MKLLTHQFLSTQLESIESKIEPKHLPWTIPDYLTLYQQFEQLRTLILSREIRVLITLPVLQELDLDKSRREIREIIRFLHERIDSNDPFVKLHEKIDEDDGSNDHFYNYRQQLKMTHLMIVKVIVSTETSNVKIVCSDYASRDFLISENLDKDSIHVCTSGPDDM